MRISDKLKEKRLQVARGERVAKLEKMLRESDESIQREFLAVEHLRSLSSELYHELRNHPCGHDCCECGRESLLEYCESLFAGGDV